MAYNIYSKSPEGFKKFLKRSAEIFLPFPYKYGLGFAKKYQHQMKYFNWLMKTQWFSPEEINQLQNNRVEIIIKHAYENVPYYTKLFDDNKIKPNDILTKDDLKDIPLLTKNIIRANFKELTAKNAEKFSPLKYATSGSTGEPLKYLNDFELTRIISAAIWRHWVWAGLKRGQTTAVFTGTLINEFGKKESNIVKKIDYEYNFSTFNMNKEIMTKYVEIFNKVKPKLIRGYPTSLEIFARFIVENNMEVYSPKAIQTGSEMVDDNQRKIMEEAFKAPLFNWYGHGENTMAAGECNFKQGLHQNQELGVFDFIKTEETKKLENVFNVITTSLWNFSMPYIRYDTEDLARITEKRLCDCGRGLLLINELIGRKADILEGPNGVSVAPSSFIHYWKNRIDKKISGIKYYQAIQEELNRLRIRIVGEPSPTNEKIILEQLQLLMGSIKIDFEYITEI
ncbi:MAG: phenylacetate--CoA ligase family protein, partial [Candidatus Thorarchaeota archaeon]